MWSSAELADTLNRFASLALLGNTTSIDQSEEHSSMVQWHMRQWWPRKPNQHCRQRSVVMNDQSSGSVQHPAGARRSFGNQANLKSTLVAVHSQRIVAD